MKDQLIPLADGFYAAIVAAKAAALTSGDNVWIYHAPRMGGWLISDQRNWRSNVIEVRPDGHTLPFCALASEAVA